MPVPSAAPHLIGAFSACILVLGCASGQQRGDATKGAESGGPKGSVPTGGAFQKRVEEHGSPGVDLRFPREPVPWIGVELRSTKDSRPGVAVTRVLSGSPAKKAGIQAGDVLMTLADVPMQSPLDVANWVERQEPGTTHPISVMRSSETRLLRVVLEGRPEFEDRLRLELVGRPAPEIAGVATFQGEASSLSELRGQVVVLEFWASFCGVCRFLGPRLDRWHRLYQPQGAEVVGITVDPPALGLRVAHRTGMSYTLASDPEAKVTEKYMASQIPVVIVIDRAGIVRDAMVGYSEGRLRETEELIAQLLSQES